MPELRTDWLTGRSVLVAENRANRPNDFEPTDGEVASATGHAATNETNPTCPFCAGNESRTPTPVYETRDANGQWQVRVVPNIFPAVELGDGSLASPVKLTSDKSQQASPAVGAHEVIIECPTHIDRLSVLSADKLHSILQAYTARLAHWRDSGNFRYGLVFKNQGYPAGASLAHLHSQLVALPYVPPAVEAEQQRAAESHRNEGECLYCQLIANEQSATERLIFSRDEFVALCPFASWQPYEMWLMPTTHEPSFETASPQRLHQLADVLHELITRLESILPGVAYNVLLRTAPWIDGVAPYSHWRIELMPRVSAFAGLEVATGVHINPLSPERAAGQLRIR